MLAKETIETDELILRHTNKQDLNDFAALVTLPAFGRLSPFGSLNKKSAERILDGIIKLDKTENFEGHEFWTVIHKKDHTYAGFIGYHPIVFEEKTQEMFFIGFNRRFWGSLIPQNAAKAVCRHAFNEGKINQFIAFVHPEDVESLYLAQTLGYQFEKQCVFFDVTVILFSLVKGALLV